MYLFYLHRSSDVGNYVKCVQHVLPKSLAVCKRMLPLKMVYIDVWRDGHRVNSVGFLSEHVEEKYGGPRRAFIYGCLLCFC